MIYTEKMTDFFYVIDEFCKNLKKQPTNTNLLSGLFFLLQKPLFRLGLLNG